MEELKQLLDFADQLVELGKKIVERLDSMEKSLRSINVRLQDKV